MSVTETICPIIEEEEEREETENNEDDAVGQEVDFCDTVSGSESGRFHVQAAKDRVTLRLEKKAREEQEGSDTDLELEDEKTDYDASVRAIYISACRKLGVVPVSYFLRHMEDERLSMAHHGLGTLGMKALAYPLMSNTYILSLNLQDNWLEGEGGEAIAEMLKENCYITELNVSDNKLGSRGCEAICEILHTNVTLQSIDLSGNGLSDNDCEAIASALYENNRLKTVILSKNNFGQTKSSVLADAISENEMVECVDLSWNHFRHTSAQNLCMGIAINSRLRVVNLSMNGLGNEGAFGVSEILKQSATLTSLDVSHNRIGPTGASVIGKALEVNEILQTLKIGHNPLGLDGIKGLLKGISGTGSVVACLDLAGVEIDKEFRTMAEELKESRDINVIHGPVLGDYVIVGKPKKKISKLFNTPLNEITTENVMVVIRAFFDANGVALYDTLLAYDRNKEKCIAYQDFMTVLSDAGVDLTLNQTEQLERLLSEYRTQDSRIDFSSLL